MFLHINIYIYMYKWKKKLAQAHNYLTWEKVNCRRPFPVPHTFNWVPSSVEQTKKMNLPGCYLQGVIRSRLLTFGSVHLADDGWQHVSIFCSEVVMRAKQISRDDRGVASSILLEVRSTTNMYEQRGLCAKPELTMSAYTPLFAWTSLYLFWTSIILLA